MARLRPRTKQFLMTGGIGALIMLLICMITGFLIFNYLRDVQNQERASLQKELEETREKLDKQLDSRQNVWVLKSDVKAGEKITADKLTVLQVPKTLIPENIAAEQHAVGKFTKFDLKRNTALLQPMLYQEGITPDDLRRQELKVIMLPLELKKDDFVDVRVVFPDGQDFIVLSKKKVKNLANGVVWYEMDESEILRMSSAIVDAYVNDAQIYALQYVDPYVQEKSTITYPANEKVLDLMRRDPNIVKTASIEMEKRLRARLEKDLNSIDPLDLQKYVSRQTGAAMSQNSRTTEPEHDLPPVAGGEPTSSMPQNIVGDKTKDAPKQEQPAPNSHPQSDKGVPVKDGNLNVPKEESQQNNFSEDMKESVPVN
ncbi:SAF domain-containing protein [Paenibacillus alvei]|uniref:SAF domain-containing protein n=1 Tax=Paenibacillus alvei TaxID=44250 RepID=UPI00028894AE|nr:SAF domain-containing protein [Paenibacillus alvei]EJW13868.1 SAF domain-containing protein [Paenibacillus alvei DSM 29]MCY9544940.1 SAF domain-containing protein [Paenibacillus alvei]MCY9708320.1 SAF domain-containing protein [Paenibacillus alvei]MCY9732992.1 SAF domain-containing protein [Paenibacillus alvei]MCY9755242.1 SAF domain-containing protein [Paenibacillus alvei]